MALEEHDSPKKRENIIHLVPEENATGRTKELYEEVKAAREGELDEELSLSKLWLMFGNDPELLEIYWHHVRYMYHRGSLSFGLKSKISLIVATVTECEGCRFFHESALKHIGLAHDTIEDLKELEIKDAGFSPGEEVILKFAEKAAESPYNITDEDLAALRDLNLSETEIIEVFDCIAFHVYAAMMQGMAGIVYPGMNRDEWIAPIR